MTEQELIEARKQVRAAHWDAIKNMNLSTGERMDLNVKLRENLDRLQREFDRSQTQG